MKKKNLLSFRGPDLYVLLLAFLVVSAIITITFFTNRNIDSLLASNRSTNSSYHLKDKVQTLLADVLEMESTQRGIILADLGYIDNEVLTIAAVERDIKQLEPLVPDPFRTQFEQLSFFVGRKVKFTRLILNTYHKRSKEASEALINTGIGESLRDSVNKYANLLESGFAKGVQDNLDMNNQRSQRLQPIITSLSLISFIAIVALSTLIIYRIRHKNLLIHNLEEAYLREQATRHELDIARRAAENSLQVKESFLANMSHEIRTPITAVLGFSNILKKSKLNKEQQQFVGYIQSSGSSLLSIVNDILDLSKLEAGMVRIEKLPFSLRDLTNEVGAMFQPSAQDKGLHLAVHVENECPENLVGDTLRLKQVLTNLVANAIKFTEEGGVRIMVRCMSENDCNAVIRFIVSDSGIGMTEEQQARLFERFEQGENDTARKYGGTGLGLAISKNLVELQGGSISVDSTPGSGTAFQVEIPFDKTQLAAPATEFIPPIMHFNSDAKVLIVDDNEVNRMLVEYMLQEWGISYKSAASGKDAIEFIQVDNYSLVLMDIQMPEMNGYTAASIIKNELHQAIPIIAMTAHVLPGEEEKCREHGMDGYISKPLQEAELKKLMFRYMGADGKSMRETAQGPAPVAGVLKDETNMMEESNGMEKESQAVMPTFIDPEFLSNKFYGNDAFIRKILEKVKQQYPVELSVLEAAISIKDPVATASAAHKMASTVSILHHGSEPMAWLKNIETSINADPECWGNVEVTFTLLKNCTGKLITELSAIMEGKEALTHS